MILWCSAEIHSDTPRFCRKRLHPFGGMGEAREPTTKLRKLFCFFILRYVCLVVGDGFVVVMEASWLHRCMDVF